MRSGAVTSFKAIYSLLGDLRIWWYLSLDHAVLTSQRCTFLVQTFVLGVLLAHFHILFKSFVLCSSTFVQLHPIFSFHSGRKSTLMVDTHASNGRSIPFDTATNAVARDRAGRRATHTSRREHYRAVDDRPEVLVWWEGHSCIAIHVPWFSRGFSDFIRSRFGFSRHDEGTNLDLKIRSYSARSRWEQNRCWGWHP